MRAIKVVLCGVVLIGLSAVVAFTQNNERRVPDIIDRGPAPTKEAGVWKSAEIRAAGQRMINNHKSASVGMMRGPHFRASVVHREGKEEPQWHLEEVDYYVIQEGTATLLSGGELLNPKDEGGGDKRGSEIRGGVKQELGPGDIVYIPPGTPHQTIFHDAKGLTYVNLHFPGVWPPKHVQ